MNRGPKIFNQCHIRIAKREEFPYSAIAECRTLAHTKKLLNWLNRNGKDAVAEHFIKTLSIHPVLLVLCLFSFIGIHSCVELYTILRTEPMHVFSLGTRRMLEECLVEMVGDYQRTSPAMKNGHKQNKAYKQIQKEVVSRLNKVLRDVAPISYGSGFRLIFSKE